MIIPTKIIDLELKDKTKSDFKIYKYFKNTFYIPSYNFDNYNWILTPKCELNWKIIHFKKDLITLF